MATARKRGGRERRTAEAAVSARQVDYRNLKNPFTPQTVMSEDRVEALHQTSLRVLEDLGMKVLLPEAREIFRKAGAKVDEDTLMVHIGRDIIEDAIRSAPKSYMMRAGSRKRDLTMEHGRLMFLAGSAAPHATDRIKGRRPGRLSDYRDVTRIAQRFDVIHMLTPGIEPQDSPTHLRHYDMTRAQLTLSDKVPFTYSRGTPQVMDCFEMIRDFRGLSDAEFKAEPWCYTIINTNSPRQLDIPMAQGLIDHAKYGQMSIITPFCLMGAMAPITATGALMLSHAEALAALVLTQLVRPGAPVLYGSFISNVDMKSGAPAFGTPDQNKASLAAGQMARHIGIPWRNGAGSAANTSDVQAAHETQMSVWGAVLAGSTVIVHSAGWLEGGLTVSYEKMITDIEMLQGIAEMCTPLKADDDEMGFSALKEVQPGGHFFAAQHTMARYKTEFYEPFSSDWSNFGTWAERGSVDATERATGIWQKILDEKRAPAPDMNRVSALDEFIAKRTSEGGAPPES